MADLARDRTQSAVKRCNNRMITRAARSLAQKSTPQFARMQSELCHSSLTLSLQRPVPYDIAKRNIPLNELKRGPFNSSKRSDSEIAAAQRLAAIVESSDDAIISKDLDGIIQSWNRGAERIFGYSADEVIGRPITMVIPPELHDQEPVILSRIARGERIEGFETVRQRKDGTQFPISLTISPVRDQEGRIVGASKIGRDISELRRSQERQELLLREMNHRVKNLFAVASGVVALSSRSATGAKELATAVQSRLAALSRAHELILPHGGDGATTSLRDLARTVLAPYESGDQAVEIEGPDISCGPGSSTSFALLLHEFATNAVKYGAFAKKDGRVTVHWTAADDRLILTWKEENIPAGLAEPAASGFGSFLVDATARSMCAEISRDWTDRALVIQITVPLARLLT